MPLSRTDVDHRVYPPYLDRLHALFDDMDTAYAVIAEHHGFHCAGCEDNCCRSRFYHHTLLEYLFLRKGFTQQSPACRQDIRKRAKRVINAEPDARPMCPLNLDGRCRLYRFRPMICRLHGLAYEFTGPDNQVRSGPGCDEFTHGTEGNPDTRLDRTTFYHRMARLEKELRGQTGFTERIRMTVAQIIFHAPDLTARPGRNNPEESDRNK